MTYHPPWPERHVDMLRGLVGSGSTSVAAAVAINARFRTDYTKNSVIGEARRLGLQWSVTKQRKKAKPRKPKAKPGRKPKPKPLPVVEAPPIMAAIRPPPDESAFALASVPVEQRLTLDALRNDTCRWPLGDGWPFGDGILFCGGAGADFAAGVPYCPHHSSLAYRAPQAYVPRLPQ